MDAVPIYNVNPGNGLSGWEAMALLNNRNGGGFGDGYGSWFGWIILLLLFGWGRGGYGFGGGFGGNGCGCGCSCNTGIGALGADLAVNNATATARNEAGLDFVAQNVNGIRNSLCDLNVNLCNQMDAVVRSFPPVMPIGLRWNYPLWNYDMSLDTDALDGKLEEVLPRAEKKDITDEAEEAAVLLSTPMPKTEFIALIQTKMDTSRNHARDILDCAKVLELVRESYENDPQNPKRNLKLISPN